MGKGGRARNLKQSSYFAEAILDQPAASASSFSGRSPANADDHI
jgi:hypothetical protein